MEHRLRQLWPSKLMTAYCLRSPWPSLLGLDTGLCLEWKLLVVALGACLECWTHHWMQDLKDNTTGVLPVTDMSPEQSCLRPLQDGVWPRDKCYSIPLPHRRLIQYLLCGFSFVSNTSWGRLAVSLGRHLSLPAGYLAFRTTGSRLSFRLTRDICACFRESETLVWPQR